MVGHAIREDGAPLLRPTDFSPLPTIQTHSFFRFCPAAWPFTLPRAHNKQWCSETLHPPRRVTFAHARTRVGATCHLPLHKIFIKKSSTSQDFLYLCSELLLTATACEGGAVFLATPLLHFCYTFATLFLNFAKICRICQKSEFA